MLSDMLMWYEMSGLKSMPSVYSISYKKKRRDLSNDIELRMLFLAVFRNKKKERKKFFDICICKIGIILAKNRLKWFQEVYSKKQKETFYKSPLDGTNSATS